MIDYQKNHEELTSTRLYPPDIYSADGGDNIGRGIFAARPFSEGERVEVAPVFLIEDHAGTLPPSIELRVYDWKELTGGPAGKAVALGYGSLYNHSDTPNLSYQADAAHHLMLYTARRPIAAHEQLTIHYDQANGEHKPEKDGWFERNGIEKRTIA